MRQHERHEYILQRVQDDGFTTIEELASTLNVTPQTIRRDLHMLESNNRVQRYHGGVGPIELSTVNTAYSERKSLHSTEKDIIGELIGQFIPDGSSLFINIGTTTESAARALLKKNGLRVVTNNLNVASILSERDDFTVIVAGGEVRNSDGGIVGEATVDLIKQFHMDYAIIGISGIQEDGTLLDYDYREVRVSQAIIENAREVLLCSDDSKFGRTPMVRLGHISQINHIFTNKKPSEKYAALFNEYDIEVHFPE